MFISYIELENFNNIETGLGAKKLTIDFTKQTNPVCVISGANGKGKTSLLSYLTPFATLGNLDVRDSNKIIIPGKEGHKLIRLIDNDKNVYEIEHFYHPGKDDSFTVKSYFKFNGEELNENGNVTSFKKLVADMLELEMDYLKLIRMGDNISNLIKSKATERKSFMGKILDSVNIYLKQHKELSLKQRDTKTVISHLIDELSKTKVDDETEIMERIKSLQERIENTNLDIYRWETDITKIKYDIEKLGYTPSSDDVLIRELERKLKAFEKALSKHEEPNTLESVKENIQSTSDRLSSEKVSLELMKKEFEMSMKQLDDAMNQYQSITVQIVKEQEELNIDSLVEHSVELLKKKNELYRSAFDEVDIKCTKDEFDDFVLFLKNTQLRLNTTYEIGKEPIREVLKAMVRQDDIPNIITASLVAVESRERSERMSIIDRLISRYSVDYDCKETNCPYMNLHKELMEIRDAKPVEKVTRDAEFYQMMRLAYENLTSIFDGFKEWKKFIEKLPKKIQEIFIVDNLFKKIGNGEIFYDDAMINEYLAFFAEYDTYKSYEKEYNEAITQIEGLKKLSRMDFLKAEKEKYEDKISSLKQQIKELSDSISLSKESIESGESTLEDLKLKQDALISFEEVENELKSLISKKNQYNGFSAKLADLAKELREMKLEQESNVEYQTQLTTNLKRYHEIIKELDEKRIEFEDMGNLLYALSNKSGIPLIHIKMYLNDTVQIANQLLDIVYDGDMYLKDFVIKEDAFQMPYVKNGKTIEDVAYASQGEQSFFNMAISSALRSQCLTEYNIALFDEVDSMFDDTNRQRFIPVLERQLELNNVEQAFLITHNQMFYKYPVDVINLDDISKSSIKVTIE